MNMYETNCEKGLTKSQVQERINRGLVNTAVDSVEKTTREIIIENTFTYFNMIFMPLGLICLRGFSVFSCKKERKM